MLCVTVSVISDILHQYVITSIQSYVKHEKWCLCHDWRHRSPFLFDILYIFIRQIIKLTAGILHAYIV